MVDFGQNNWCLAEKTGSDQFWQEKLGLNRFWPRWLVLSEFGQKNCRLSSALAEKAAPRPEKLVVVDFGHKNWVLVEKTGFDRF